MVLGRAFPDRGPWILFWTCGSKIVRYIVPPPFASLLVAWRVLHSLTQHNCYSTSFYHFIRVTKKSIVNIVTCFSSSFVHNFRYINAGNICVFCIFQSKIALPGEWKNARKLIVSKVGKNGRIIQGVSPPFASLLVSVALLFTIFATLMPEIYAFLYISKQNCASWWVKKCKEVDSF
jgi:hypothetical protein